jgi:hypothetical protein
MEPLTEPMSTAWPFPFVPQDWEHTPTTVQASVHTLQDELIQLRAQVEELEARLKADSTTSQRPPSSGTHLRRDTVIPQWFQASKAAAASDGHAVHF